MPDLRDAFRTRSKRQFACQVAISDVTSKMAERMKMQVHEVMEAQITALVSIIQARAMPEEWATVGNSICEEIKRRLTVVQN